MKFSSYADFRRRWLPAFHDARFQRADVSFDSRTGVFTLVCWIRDRDLPPAVSLGRHDWRKVRLSIESVLDARVALTGAPVRFYEIGSIHFTRSNRLVIQGHYVVDITLTTAEMAGQIDCFDEWIGQPF